MIWNITILYDLCVIWLSQFMMVILCYNIFVHVHINIVDIFCSYPITILTYEYLLHTWYNIYDLYTVN